MDKPPDHTSQNCRLGLDVGGTDIKAAILSNQNRVLNQFKLPSLAAHGPQSVRKAIALGIETALKINSNINSLGIGCAGSVNIESGVVFSSPNFRDWNDVPLATWVQSDCGLPVTVHNDANCATVAEWRLGAGRGFSSLILLTFGTGIGGGAIINDQLFTGASGTAGELGHLSISFNGIPCSCGNTGCFERYCSATALTSQLPNRNAQEIFAGAQGDEQCRVVVDSFLTALNVGLVSIANIFDPQCILLGGGLAQGFPPYISAISNQVKKHCFPVIGKNLVVRICELGNWAGAIGAALQGKATH